MGRQSTDEPTTTMMGKGSSIALLQERFRQLQRVREKREEREGLLKLFSEEPGNFFSFQSEQMIFPPPSTTHDNHALFLRLNSLSKPAEFRAIKSNSPRFDKEVDTSLHL
ncbi:hypothetical protein Vadar_010176 [Vaccinium darrowii]|uniref:Uncharacterized protein n=1 Tax=Vaccinium darrowii TaxID=229202 RepID=A0ACB7XQZ3_9ERIC|nr:hypothetical protein Vadar_010176 [Vaccinium darrowii]